MKSARSKRYYLPLDRFPHRTCPVCFERFFTPYSLAAHHAQVHHDPFKKVAHETDIRVPAVPSAIRGPGMAG